MIVAAVSLIVGIASERGTTAIALALLAASGSLLLLWTGIERTGSRLSR